MLPKHHRSGFFLKKGLFKSVSQFAQLEERIAALSTNKERGDAFEVFAEAYFATQKIAQAEEVYPLDKTPRKILNKLGLHSHDLGVDGVIKTSSGDYHAYQVKFRTGRPGLNWQEISTFMGLSDRVNQRVLFTNCNRLPKVMNERTGFVPVLGYQLDTLGKRDFDAIQTWLRKGEVRHKPKSPFPHQKIAIKKITKELAQEDRVTALMACATGKSLVSLWVAEKLESQTILVLVPSLALVRQLLHEWLRETRLMNVAFLCVCSDPTVKKGADELIITQADLDFPVTTDSRIVTKFLQGKSVGVRIVFSTFQSAHVVAKGMGKRKSFDLGIFDEAHKTAGRKGSRNSFALSDKNLRIKKRLFMTATPRHYDISKRNKEGDIKLVYSMDIPDTYGQVAHSLSFAEAAKQGIICHYKIIISIVTDEMLTDDLLRHGQTTVDGDVVKTAQVANQIALSKAAEKYDLRRIFTFHSSVASARSFTETGGEGISFHLPQYSTFHVNGKMPTAEREGFMAEFSEASRGIMSNARCLTEGVDVPAVDMVAFLSPKKSRVDIVQATGRAMRIDPANPNKKTGFVLVPIYLKQELKEDVEDALDRSEFNEIWNVLQALQEQDVALAEIIQQMREERGRTKGYDDTRLREKIEVLGPSISLGTLREAITAKCLERLGVTWDERYGELVSYMNVHGDCNVPQNYIENPVLATWIATQRTTRKRGRLDGQRIKKLDNLGFIWDSYAAVWEEMFTELLAYKQTHQNLDVPHNWSENTKLAHWVNQQRGNWNNGLLSAERIQRLNEVGFIWNRNDFKWDQKFAELVAYMNIYGDNNEIPKSGQYSRLYTWLASQKTSYRKDKLRKDRAKRLTDLGVDLGFINFDTWEDHYENLVAYKKVYGTCEIKIDDLKNVKIYRWATKQRVERKRGNLADKKIKKLDEIGFTWDTDSEKWNSKYEALVAYKEKHGDCLVPNKWKKNIKLANWVDMQRGKRRSGKLTKTQIKRLEAIDFAWDRHSYVWNQNFNDLVDFKSAHGDCNPPRHNPKYKKLSLWVTRQRSEKKKGQLNKAKIKALNEIGFIWGAPRTS